MMWHVNYVVLVLMTYVLMPDIGGSCDIDVGIVPLVHYHELARHLSSSGNATFFILLMLKML